MGHFDLFLKLFGDFHNINYEVGNIQKINMSLIEEN